MMVVEGLGKLEDEAIILLEGFMTLDRKTLLNSLRMVMPGIESGNVVLQGSDSFIFHDGKMFTYNDSIAVVVPLEQTGLVNEDIEGAVHGKEFYNIVSKFTNDEMTLKVTDKGTWQISCGRAKAELTLMDFNYKSRLDGMKVDDKDWVDLPENFTDALASCKMSNNKSAMAGVYVRDDKVISTDGYQINLCTLKGEMPTFWITDSSLNELIKLKGMKKVQVGKNWVHFLTEDEVVFSIKTLNSSSFPYDKITALIDSINPKDDDLHTFFPKELFPAIERADNFAFDLGNQSVVRLALSKDKIVVSSEKASGKYSEEIAWDKAIDKEFDEVNVCVNASMMQAMASHSLEFYMMKMINKKGKESIRLLFVSDSSKHLMSTFNEG